MNETNTTNDITLELDFQVTVSELEAAVAGDCQVRTGRTTVVEGQRMVDLASSQDDFKQVCPIIYYPPHYVVM